MEVSMVQEVEKHCYNRDFLISRICRFYLMLHVCVCYTLKQVSNRLHVILASGFVVVATTAGSVHVLMHRLTHLRQSNFFTSHAIGRLLCGFDVTECKVAIDTWQYNAIWWKIVVPKEVDLADFLKCLLEVLKFIFF